MPIKRTYSDILQNGRNRLEQNSPVNNFNPQSISKAFLDIQAVELEKIYDTIEYVSTAQDPTLAIGSDLDKIGYLVGETRNSSITPSDYSTTNFYFYIDPRINMSFSALIKKLYNYEERNILVTNGYLFNDTSGEPSHLVIKSGTGIQNTDGTISYTTINDVNLSDNEVYVGIVATDVGPNFNVQTNTLIAHTIHQIPELRKISAYIKNTNRYPIQNGRYSLTDDEYRYRISTSRLSIKSNELSIVRSASSVPGVRDIYYEKNKYGNGTANIIVEGISPLVSQGLIDAVKEKIEQEVSTGDTIYVNRPEYFGIELNLGLSLTIETQNESLVRQQVRSNIIQYINDLPVAGEIIWNEIIERSMSVDGVEDVIPKVFKYGNYDFLEIDEKFTKDEGY